MASITETFQSGAPPQPASRFLPAPFRDSKEPFHVIAQGAEGVVYRTHFLSSASPSLDSESTKQRGSPQGTNETQDTDATQGNAALKIRYPKPWRHPILDKRLTRQRILAEARVLVKLARELREAESGAAGVPALLGMSWDEGWLATEWIEGRTVKMGVRGWEAVRAKDGDAGAGLEDLKALLRKVGAAVGRLHACGIVHGDLTTSNMMIRAHAPATTNSTAGSGEEGASAGPNLEGQIVLIDFGLAQQSSSDEDRAVDLYVLERAFGSTHPKVMEGRYNEAGDGEVFDLVLQAYAKAMGKAGRVVLRRLEDVRMRGRKRSMLG